MVPGRPVLNGNAPVCREPEGGAPTSGDLPEESRNRGGEPAPQFDQTVGCQGNPSPEEEAEMRGRNRNGETYLDATSLRLSGRDQDGKNWSSLIFGCSGVRAAQSRRHRLRLPGLDLFQWAGVAL
jgi:hypothetical protein